MPGGKKIFQRVKNQHTEQFTSQQTASTNLDKTHRMMLMRTGLRTVMKQPAAASVILKTTGFLAPKFIRLQSTTAPITPPKPVTPHAKGPVTVDRELPDPLKDRNRNRIQFVLFWCLMGVSSVVIFNYEKTNSPIVTTTLHFLRRSKLSRELLGDEIDFSTMFPWISGELNQVKGVVNIRFTVKGTKNSGEIVLVADRDDRQSDFLIHQWSLTVDNKVYDLLDDKTVDFSV